MTKETVVGRTLLKRQERERDLITDLTHKIVEISEKGIEERRNSVSMSLERDLVKLFLQDKTAKDFLLVALEANGLDRSRVGFTLEHRDGSYSGNIAVDLTNLDDLPFGKR